MNNPFDEKPKVQSSVHINPPKNFNEWADNLYGQVKQNFKNKISCIESDSTLDVEKTL